MLEAGVAGWATLVGQDEVNMPWYGFKVDLVDNSEEIAKELKKLIQVKDGDDTNVQILENGNTIVTQISEKILRWSADYSPAFTMVCVALGQIIAKLADLYPLEHPYKLYDRLILELF